jgi:hypothetical protein
VRPRPLRVPLDHALQTKAVVVVTGSPAVGTTTFTAVERDKRQKGRYLLIGSPNLRANAEDA